MGIDAQLRDEGGNVLESVSDGMNLLSRAATNGSFASSRLLRYLVPWGDAVFNQAQAPDLLDDIRLLSRGNLEEKLTKYLRDLLPLAERLERETHIYLWFVGD